MINESVELFWVYFDERRSTIENRITETLLDGKPFDHMYRVSLHAILGEVNDNLWIDLGMEGDRFVIAIGFNPDIREMNLTIQEQVKLTIARDMVVQLCPYDKILAPWKVIIQTNTIVYV